MVALLELKEKIKKLYGHYDVYIIPAARFVLALVSLLMLNGSVGYMERLKNPLITASASIVCAFLPNSVTVILLSGLLIGHLYALSAELALVVLCLFILMYLVYFRFTPKKGYILIITIILLWLKMPYFIPIALGLTSGIVSVIPMSFGIIIYHIIESAGAYESAMAVQADSTSMQKVSFILENLLNNKEMFLIIAAFCVSIVVVYMIRRLSVNNAWTYAILSGVLVQFIILMVGKIVFSVDLNIILIIVGMVLAAILGFLLNIVFFNIDYKRTEFVQYEDDEYYYYVKAIPKINIADEEVKIKRINAQKVKRTNDFKNEKIREDRKSENYDSKDIIEDDGITFIDR